MTDTPKTYWHSRGYLPHFDHPGLLQMITYRLADSAPASVVEQMVAVVKTMPKGQRQRALRKRIEEWIDAGYGACVLRQPEVADLIVGNWQHYAGVRYDLIAWTVMPNHVHVLVRVYDGNSLSRIVQAWKGYSGKKIRELQGKTGAENSQRPVWHRDYWDRFIRNEQHFSDAVRYIEYNPVKAGLVREAEDWPWSSRMLAGNEENVRP